MVPQEGEEPKEGVARPGVVERVHRPRRRRRTVAKAALASGFAALAIVATAFGRAKLNSGLPDLRADRAANRALAAALTTTATTLPPPPKPVPVVTRIDTTDPVVFITIDDGWQPVPEAVDLLRTQQAPVTAFLIAWKAERNADFYRDVLSLGGTVENHSLSHERLDRMPADEVRAELCGTSDTLEPLFGRRPLFFRPPYGAYDDEVLLVASDCGLYANVMWSAEVDNGVLTTDSPGDLSPGDIVLLHWGPGLAADLRVLFDAMARLGLRAAPLHEYLAPT